MEKDLKLGPAKVRPLKKIDEKPAMLIYIKALDILITMMWILFVVILFKSCIHILN